MGATEPQHLPGSVGEPAGGPLSNLLNLLIPGCAQQELHACIEYIRDIMIHSA